MKEIRRYLDFVLFVVYIVFVISIFLQGCSIWWVRHSYCTIPFYCQYFPNLKINYKKVFAFMLKFHVFALLMHFMNRHLLIKVNSKENFQFLRVQFNVLMSRIFKEFCNLYFTKLLEDHIFPTNININERLWTGKIRSKWKKFEVHM